LTAFGGLTLTNKGKTLQSKAQIGVELHFTRIGVGDGELGSSSILSLNNLINEVKSLEISKLKTTSAERAVVGGVLSNQDIDTGFYYRELGVFANDPDAGEILYCYANSGDLAEYIPPGGGEDIIEKNIDVQMIIGDAGNVTAQIDNSLVYVSQQEFSNHGGNHATGGSDPISPADIGAAQENHSHTPSEVGLGNVNNEEQATKIEHDNLVQRIGQNTNLSTDEKSTIIDALNEVNQKTNEHQAEDTTNGDDPHGAKTYVDNHKNDTSNPHNVTTSQIGAETPSGAQEKADAAESNAKTYADDLNRIKGYKVNTGSSVEWVKVGNLAGTGTSIEILLTETSDYGTSSDYGRLFADISVGNDIGEFFGSYRVEGRGSGVSSVGYVQTGDHAIDVYVKADDYIKGRIILLGGVGFTQNFSNTTTEPSGIVYLDERYDIQSPLYVEGENLKQFADDFKSVDGDIATAIEDKGGTLSDGNSDGYYDKQEMVDGVNSIPQAKGDASTSDVLEGHTFSSETAGIEKGGIMTNQGAYDITPSDTNQSIPEGYHNGKGIVEGDSNLTSDNIKDGVNIFGVNGTAKVYNKTNLMYYRGFHFVDFEMTNLDGSGDRSVTPYDQYVELYQYGSTHHFHYTTSQPIDLTNMETLTQFFDYYSTYTVLDYMVGIKDSKGGSFVADSGGMGPESKNEWFYDQEITLNVGSYSGLYYVAVFVEGPGYPDTYTKIRLKELTVNPIES